MIKNLDVDNVPTCSTIASGNVLLSTLTPDDLNGLGIDPFSFGELLNFATTTVWPVAKPYLAKVAKDILHRAKDYLM
jgi:hypothetical protein